MAPAPAASAISLPFRTCRRRYISTLIWTALHRSLRKHFHNFSPLAPTPLCHILPSKAGKGSVLRRTARPLTEKGVRFTLRSQRRFIKTSLSTGRRCPLCPLEHPPQTPPPAPDRFDVSRAVRAGGLMEGAEEAKTS